MNSEEILVEIARHLLSANDLIDKEKQESRTEGHITRAQVLIDKHLDGLPLDSYTPQTTPIDHLEKAHQLAEEHLGVEGEEGNIRGAVWEAFSEAEEEFRKKN